MPSKDKSERASQRKRGRPSGKNRTPLSLDERRARNAQYERERRNETADAFLHLAEAAGCDQNISNADLLATVISKIQRATETNSSDNIDNLKRINDNLESQILTLQGRLGIVDANFKLIENDSENDHVGIKQECDSVNNSQSNYKVTEKHIKKRKRGFNSVYQRKRRKLNSAQWSDDSGIESQSPQPEIAPSVQYISEAPSLGIQYPCVIEEPVHRATQAQIDLNAELYQQLYSEPEGRGTAAWTVYGTQTPYLMETLAQSLITIPAITPPQEESTTWSSHEHTDPSNVPVQLRVEPFAPDLEPLLDRELIEPQLSLLKIEHPEQSTQNERDTVQQVQPNLDLLTETEKGVITEWILNGDFLGNCGEAQLTGYTTNYTLGYS